MRKSLAPQGPRSAAVVAAAVLAAAFALVLPLHPAAAAAANSDATSSDAATSDGTGFEQILQHYEAVRLALASDSVEGIGVNARRIAAVVEALDRDWSAARAGVSAGEGAAARALLPELQAAVGQLVRAETLETSRDAFYSLSKPLVRLRKAATGELPVVAYCSMSQRSWLQPEGELGNPYYGSSMLQCGEVVDG